LYLLLRRFPTATELKEFKQDLNQRRNKFNLSTLKLHKNFPPGFHQSRLLSLNFMELQPHSKFYQHRKETLKQSHWEWILEDILDIIAIFPPLLHQMVYPQDPLPKKSLSYAELMALTSPDSFIIIEATPPPAPAANSKSPKKPSSTTAATVATPASPAATQPFPSKSVQDAVDRYLIENTILDGGHPIVHAMRLVNCTLTDPYLAVAAGITANSALRRHDLFLGTRYMKLSAHLIGGLMEIFWDRALLHPLENPKSVEIPFLTKFLQISDKEME
jgi:citrate synthase